MTLLLTALTTLAIIATLNGELRAMPFAVILLLLTITSLLRK